MAPRTDEQGLTAGRKDSLINYTNGEYGLEGGKRARRRACPILAVLGLLVHMVFSCLGVAMSVLIILYDLQVTSAGVLGLVARILLFAASCISVFYVIMHAFAAREDYVRSRGGPQLYSFFTVAVTVMVMRLGVPVWIGAVALNALVAVQQGFDLSKGFRGNAVWVQLIISSAALLSLLIMVLVTETTDRPFATSIFSRKTFLRGMDEPRGRVSTFDLSVSRQGLREKDTTSTKTKSRDGGEPDVEHTAFDRSAISTPESRVFPTPAVAAPRARPLSRPPQWGTVRQERVRSQLFPTPLETVFTTEAIPPDSQYSPKRDGAHFAWRPPTRDSTMSVHTQAASTITIPRETRAFLDQEQQRQPVEPVSPLSIEIPRPISIQPLATELSHEANVADMVESLPTIPIPADNRVTQTPPAVAQAPPQRTPATPAAPKFADVLGQISQRAAARQLARQQAEATTPPKTSLDQADEPNPLARSNTDTNAHLVRNFSRPRKRGSWDSDLNDDDDEQQETSSETDVSTGPTASGARGRPGGNTRADPRRSSSLPPARTSAAAQQLRTGNPYAWRPPPRLTPFPPPPKVKGLGQGSTRRLDERISMWRDGVE